MVLHLKEFKGLFEKYRCSKAIYINLDFIYLKLNSVLLHIYIYYRLYERSFWKIEYQEDL